ncbi:MAG: hypothetical protein Q8L34_02300 [Candidatus Woesearchaeota archaeon]|nr:hypothetical protein [Candidatus Woesearchaeota archaeon]
MSNKQQRRRQQKSQSETSREQTEKGSQVSRRVFLGVAGLAEYLLQHMEFMNLSELQPMKKHYLIHPKDKHMQKVYSPTSQTM